MNDLDLLRRYEPVVRYTEGELFFPCAVDGYLARSHLWVADAERNLTLLAHPGELTVAKLGQYRTVPREHRLYLQFVQDPLTALDFQRWRRDPDRPALPNPSRLQRIGLTTRILDGLFDLSLVVRGRVPGGTAAAAHIQYRAMQQEDPRRVYYGRVVRDGGYIILHYLFFFPMNDWRSSFNGVNNHESDWEQILIYLTSEKDGELTPRWIAFASHDFSGDDLRRRWDDPEVEKVDGEHPVIYAGAGSHASYFTRGEYLMQVEPAALVPLHAIGAAIDRTWMTTLRQATPLNVEQGIRSLQSIPFVDYARGDGQAIGPQQADTWTPILISDDDGWVDGYRGLWGLDTWDPLGGERAPAGPKYERDGNVRLVWRDPLAWAGLDKVLPTPQVPQAMQSLLEDLHNEEDELTAAIANQRERVRRLELELETLRSTQFLHSLEQRRAAELTQAENKLAELTAQLNDTLELREAGADHLAQLEAGNFGPPRAHIQHAHVPLPPVVQLSRFARAWIAVSGGLVLLIMVGLVYFRPASWPVWLMGSIILVAAIEAATQSRLIPFLLRLSIILAVITSAILLYRFWLLGIVLGICLVVAVMLRDNLREMFNR